MLYNLSRMTPHTQFAANIAPAQQLLAMYRELRANRHLGRRGRLSAAHQDLLWLPRSAVVASVSALDAYIHSSIYDRLPHCLAVGATPSDSLCEKLSELLPIKNAVSFRRALPTLAANNTTHQLIERLRIEVLQFQAFQAPDKIIDAYGLIGHDGIFESVAAAWPGPNNTPQRIKDALSAYARRRNRIAHEADIDANGRPGSMQPDYAYGCRDFISKLEARLNQVVYGV